MCNAIEYAHSRGVLHRDLKPGNIMLGKYGETLVVDWGLAKALGATSESATPKSADDEMPLVPFSGSGTDSTLPGAALGTPAYMSPEQALGRLDLLGPPSDVYSLGATLYCLLTGRAPFVDKVVADVLAKVQRGGFPRPRQLRPDVPAPLEAICLRAMAVRPADRYGSAAELGRDVERWLDDAPVTAWPEPFTVKARRWINRNRTLVTASAAAVLVACVSLGIAAVMLGTAYDAEKLAREDAVAREKEVTQLNANLVKANVAEKAAKNDALESEKLALHQSDVALKSLTSIVNQVQDELEDVPGTGEVRKNLLNEALRLLRTVNETPGNTAKLLAQRLVAHNHMGQIYSAQERRKEAEDQYKLSRALALQVLAFDPKSDRARKDVAASTLKSADALIYYHGDTDAAVPLLRECLKLYEAMVGDLRKHPNGNPAIPLAQRVALRDAERGLADTYDRFGEVASCANDLAKTAEWLEKAKTIRQHLYDETDRADHMRRDAQVSILGQSIMLLASLRYAQGDLKAHLAGRKQVALLRREVAEHRPNSLRALGLWAAAEGDLSDALLLSGEAKEALACAVKSLQVLQQVAAAHPEDVDYRGRLAHAYYRTAVGWMRLGDRKAALGEFQKSLAIRQKLHNDQPDATMRQHHKQPIMLLVARCGDPAGAEKLALAQREYWLKKKANGVPLSEIASCFALCLDAVAPEKPENQRSAEEKQLRQHYVELALETFRQAQASGFTDVLFVDYDPNVDPLRGIGAFEEWRASFKRAATGKIVAVSHIRRVRDPCRLVRQVKEFGRLQRNVKHSARPLPPCAAGEGVGRL